MEITLQEQEVRDLDWFCVDEEGHLGNFTTAGFKYLPKSVAQSAEDLQTATEYFNALAPTGGYEVDPCLNEEIQEPGNRGDRYLRSFVAMAEKGLFSFDIATYVKPGTSYFRVASPRYPLTFTQLPKNIQEILGRTMLRGKLLRGQSRIPYHETLGM